MSRHKVTVIFIVLVLWSASTQSASIAQDAVSAPGDNRPEKQEYAGGCLPGTIALFPGILIHGAGHYVAGDRETAGDLLILEGASLGLFMVSAAYYAYTGASRKVSAPLVPVIATSGSLFVFSWFADIYGAGFGMGRDQESQGNSSVAANRLFSPFFGIATIDDPQFDYSRFFHFGAAGQYNALHFETAAWHATGNRRYLGEAGFDLIGKAGPFLDEYHDLFTAGPLVRAGYHDFGDYGFRKSWLDVSLATRIFPGFIRHSMRGSFVFFEWGWNREWVTFPGVEKAPVLTADQLLFMSGFGVSLGSLFSPVGSLQVYYNHRRDDFTGGLPGGFTGYIGATVEIFLYTVTSIMIDYSYGSASVMVIRCSYRFPGPV